MTCEKKKALLWWAVLVAAVLVPFFLFEERVDVMFDSLLSSAGENRFLAAAVLFAVLSSDIFLPVPSCLASALCGSMLGPWLGFAVSFSAMTVSAAVGYLIGRFFGALSRYFTEKTADRMDAAYSVWGPRSLFVMRPVPVLAECSCVYAGVRRYPFFKSAMWTISANVVVSAVYALLGHLGRESDSPLPAFAAVIALSGAAYFLMKGRKTAAPKGLRIFFPVALSLSVFFPAAAFSGQDEGPGKGTAGVLWSHFSHPPREAKPWCYWFWVNGNNDRETITADLEAIRRVGFGAVLMIDSRGYWEDKDHVINPKVQTVWGSDEWYDLVEFSIRECARLGLEFTMNASASGGTLNGFIDGKEYETDITDSKAVTAHLERSVGPLLGRVPELVGKTFTHIYSVSYEGNVKKGGTWRVIKDTFYATMRSWAHAKGLKVFSESGGPWVWGSGSTKLDCDQLDLLAHNDIPQGEFWPQYENLTHPDTGRANRNGRFFQRAVVLSARREGRRIASMEAFTHMHRHYSVDPAFLKPLADISFADGANRLVWHTFTCSPARFGVPGAEYFAGSHINRNVTWHEQSAAFIGYLARCQALLQRGEYVDDGEFSAKPLRYRGYGRYRAGNRSIFTAIHRREGDVDFFFVAGEGKGAFVLNTVRGGRDVEIWDAVSVSRRKAVCADLPSGKSRVELDLPKGGSCFVVFAPPGNPPKETRFPAFSRPVPGPWNVSFRYHEGISAVAPSPMVMEKPADFTSFGKEGDAMSDRLRYFSGTAVYRTSVQVTEKEASSSVWLSLGKHTSGLFSVFVNGVDCGVVWCAPWRSDISAAVKPGGNVIEIRYVNNWYNRLVGDCFLPPEKRVTRSTLQYWNVPRRGNPSNSWSLRPTVYSGPSSFDTLQPSGLVGPVEIMSDQ